MLFADISQLSLLLPSVSLRLRVSVCKVLTVAVNFIVTANRTTAPNRFYLAGGGIPQRFCYKCQLCFFDTAIYIVNKNK